MASIRWEIRRGLKMSIAAILSDLIPAGQIIYYEFFHVLICAYIAIPITILDPGCQPLFT